MLNNTDTFIVYRNPIEAMFWDTLVTNPLIVVNVIGFIVLSITLTALILSLFEKRKFRKEIYVVWLKIFSISTSCIVSGYIWFILIPLLLTY